MALQRTRRVASGLFQRYEYPKKLFEDIEQQFPEQGDRNDASAFIDVILAGNPELL